MIHCAKAIRRYSAHEAGSPRRILRILAQNIAQVSTFPLSAIAGVAIRAHAATAGPDGAADRAGGGSGAHQAGH